MYYNDYEDYMRSVLGYNNMNTNMPNMYNQDYYMLNNRMPCQMSTYQNDCLGNTMGESVEDLYPDIKEAKNVRGGDIETYSPTREAKKQGGLFGRFKKNTVNKAKRASDDEEDLWQ